MKEKDLDVTLATLDRTDWTALETIFGHSSRPDREIYLFDRLPQIRNTALRQAFLALLFAVRLFTLKVRHRTSVVINMSGEVVDSLGDLVYINAIPLRLMYRFPEIRPNQGVQWSLFSLVYSVLLKLLSRFRGTAVTNSKFNQRLIAEYVGRKTLVINPPVRSQQIATQFTSQNRINTVVTVARFRSAKGLALIPKIASLTSDGMFLLIGTVDAGSEDCLRQLSEQVQRLHVEDRVHIFQNKPHEFTLKALLNAKVFLHTQRAEAFGMSVVEAMAAGCVPIVPHVGGPWEEILNSQEGVYGYSYTSPQEAADKIMLLFHDEKLRREVSARAMERAMAFDMTVFDKKFLSVVESVSPR
ncbi:MAG: glycosyltransferase [Candidatus Bathyarchaeia archaeon]